MKGIFEGRNALWRQSRWAMFLAYTGWLLWLLLFRRLGAAQAVSLGEYAAGHMALVPLRTVSEQLLLAGQGSRQAWFNLGGNLLLFVPVGWFLPAIFRPLRRFWRFIAVFDGCIAAVELAQLLLRVGFCDVDDLLLNCAGASLGFLFRKLNTNKKA